MRPPNPRTTPEPAYVVGARWIPLTHGKFALVDESDFDKLSAHNWCYAYGYATSWVGGAVTRMHSLLVNCNNGEVVDHENRDKLDNRKFNLRVAARNGLNVANRAKMKNNTSGFIGVSWNKRAKRWVAGVKVQYKAVHVGYYDSPEEAAKARDKAALEHFGKFATLNYPLEWENE